jgi:predicted dehydrogenase
MRFLVIGLGSMGKRRIRCLKYIVENDIIGFDIRNDKCDEVREKYGIETFNDFEKALEKNPDVFIISTPPDLHYEYAIKAYHLKKHFFTESNFLYEGFDKLIEIEEKGEVVACPSFTMFYNPVIKKIKELIEKNYSGKIYYFIHHLSAFLPLWHPWENYKNEYYSKKETSGTKEMVAFEITYLNYLFGDVKNVFAIKRKVSELEIDFEDLYHVILEYENGIIGNLIVDVISQPSGRYLKIICDNGYIFWNSEEEKLKFYNVFEGKEEDIKIERKIKENGYSVKIYEEMYIEEIKDFLKAIKKEKGYPYSFKKEKKIIEILKYIEKSAKEGRLMEVIYEN